MSEPSSYPSSRVQKGWCARCGITGQIVDALCADCRRKVELRSDTIPNAARDEARRMLDILHGEGPAGKMNYAYADPYYARSIEDRFGISIEKLKELLNYE